MSDSFSVSRSFDAARERVFEAWTEPALFAQWFGTAAVEVPLQSVRLDAREGGSWTAQMRLPAAPEAGRDEPMVIDWSGEYRLVDPPRRLELTINDDPSRAAGAPLEVVFEPLDGGGTRMTLTQTSPDFTPEQRQATIAGYGGFFDAMAVVLGEA